MLYDSNNTVYTPGFGQRSGGADRFSHAGLDGTSYLSDGAGAFPSALRYEAFGNRTATAEPAHPTPFLFGGAGGAGAETEYADGSDTGLGLVHTGGGYYDPAGGWGG